MPAQTACIRGILYLSEESGSTLMPLCMIAITKYTVTCFQNFQRCVCSLIVQYQCQQFVVFIFIVIQKAILWYCGRCLWRLSPTIVRTWSKQFVHSFSALGIIAEQTASSECCFCGRSVFTGDVMHLVLYSVLHAVSGSPQQVRRPQQQDCLTPKQQLWVDTGVDSHPLQPRWCCFHPPVLLV